MSKQDPYRFNLRFDENDEDHRMVCDFLNDCGRKKARYIVKAVMAYWNLKNETVPVVKPEAAQEVKDEKEDSTHLVSVEEETYEADQAEVSLMMKNYRMFDALGEEME